MAQIVHDLAPHATLAFATAFSGEDGLRRQHRTARQAGRRRRAGADVIVDDVGYFEEPFFQDGPVAAAIDKVTAEGVTYLSAAGNDNLFDAEGHEIASWEAPGIPRRRRLPGDGRRRSKASTGRHCMDFDPGAATDDDLRHHGRAPDATLTVDLQWAEPWDGVGTDLDAFLLNADGERARPRSVEDNTARPGPSAGRDPAVGKRTELRPEPSSWRSTATPAATRGSSSSCCRTAAG